MSELLAVVLAAGEGKRMNSKKSKVLHTILGVPIIQYVCEAAIGASAAEIVAVVGHKGEQVKECLDGITCVWQHEQLGTGHAVMQAEDILKSKTGTVLILCGDTPAITQETLSQLVKVHNENKNAATILTAKFDDPTGYGRIIRNNDGGIKAIVEHKDASYEQLLCQEVNSGIFCFDIQKLLSALGKINNDNNQGEYYITDTIEILISQGDQVGGYMCADNRETMGINDRKQLSEAENMMKRRINERHMMNGVTIVDPENTYISRNVSIGKDSVIWPGCMISENCVLGEDCMIGPNTQISGSSIGERVNVKQSVVMDSDVSDDTTIGPFAYIRPGSKIGRHVKVGDFVEIKNATIGDKTSISHLTYVGDADVGRNVNLGCGVVFVNYDGHTKNRTVVEDNCFIGCNTNLVSPVTVKANAYTGAGSTITEDVPENGLGIARARQVNKEEWVVKKGKIRKEKP